MGCTNSKIVSTTKTEAKDKTQAVDVPRPASIVQQPQTPGVINRRSGIPISISKRSTVPITATSPGTASNSNSFKENKTPPNSPPNSPPSLVSRSAPKRVDSKHLQVSNGNVRSGGVITPLGSMSRREIKVQKRPRSRGSADLLNNRKGTLGEKTLLRERSMNGGNGTGDISNNSTLSAASSKPLLAATRKTSRAVTTLEGGRGEGGKISNSSLTSKPPSLELLVVVDPEVEGKTRIPRPCQTYQLADPRRYVRLARSWEELREAAAAQRRCVSATHSKVRNASTMVVGQHNGRVKTATRPPIKQRPKSMMLLNSPEAKAVGLGSWATGRVDRPVQA